MIFKLKINDSVVTIVENEETINILKTDDKYLLNYISIMLKENRPELSSACPRNSSLTSITIERIVTDEPAGPGPATSEDNISKNEEKIWNEESDMYLINEVISNWKDLQTFSKKKVFEKIANNISTAFNKKITGTQVDSKWKYLVFKYKNYKKTIESTGTGTIKWKYYDILNDFLFNKSEILAPATCSSSKGLVINKCDNQNVSGSQTNNSNLTTSPLVSSMTRKREKRETTIEKRHREKMQKIDKLQGSIDSLINIIKKEEPE